MKLAVIFNGQGAHYQGMAQDFNAEFDEAQSVFDLAESVTQIPLRHVIQHDIEALSKTKLAQLAIVASSLAIFKTIQSHLPKVHYMAGLSLGEYSALMASGYITLETGFDLLKTRGELMSDWCQQLQAHNPVQMRAVIGHDLSTVTTLLHASNLIERIHIANINASSQIIIGGYASDLDQFATYAKAHQVKKMLPLKVEGPFHTPYMAPMANEYADKLNQVEFKQGEIPVISNTTLNVHQPHTMRSVLVDHLTQPVKWQQTIDYFVREGITHLIQIGPGHTLQQLLKREADVPKCLVVDKVEDIQALSSFLDGE